MKDLKFISLVFILSLTSSLKAQFTFENNEATTTNEIVAPVLRLSNELRLANTFSAADPTIGTMDNSSYGINLHKTEGIGFALNGIHQMVFQPNGNVGFGTTSPLGKLHVSTGTSGDALFRLEADTDNNNESDNPMIELRQDGGQVGVNMGFSEEYFGGNIFGIGTRYLNADSWGAFRINTLNGYVGIGTTPQEKFQVENSFVFHVGGHDVLGFKYQPTGGVDLDATKYAAEVRFDPVGGFLRLGTSSGLTDSPITRLSISKEGNVGIGNLSTGSHRLAVEGSIGAREIKVEASGWSDFVFEEGYSLPTLEEVELHIKEFGHLKDIPSASDVAKDGINLGEMDAKLLQKIEELTLYTVEQEKDLNEKDSKIKLLEEKLDLMNQQLQKIQIFIDN
ncbi:hypothetical protein [Sediminicola sp. YIK13]|uniref:hypothetical protein n=1 Tax=Sediminicola sp. YIK13 TaxID=1453352 RepID=UPI000783B93E|nr:hypothetical protein [Sediminicola sp. YIK13]